MPLALPALLLLALASLLAGLATGSADLPFTQVWAALTGHGEDTVRAIVLDLRLPRVLAAFACGGLLALAGLLLQTLLRNPLAEPYLLGISGGASVGALAILPLGLGAAFLQGAALGGALAALALLLLLNRGPWNPYRLILTGVALSAGSGAAVSLMLSLSPATGVKGMLFWLMGDPGQAEHPYAALVLLAFFALLALLAARDLDVLALGEAKARSLGVPVGPLRAGALVAASLAAAVAVAEAGTIGFVGLVVPHLLRLAGLHGHRRLVPACLLTGGALLVLADLAARTLIAPRLLPVGVITALAGVPLLLFLLQREARAGR